MSLTPKQKKVLEFIDSFINEHGSSPTFQEIKDHFGLKSLGSVVDYVNYLKKAGFITTNDNSTRNLELVEQAEKNELVPILGSVAAGSPLEIADHHSDFISVAQSMIPAMSLKNKCFALKVQGDSMIDQGIFNGDHVIIKSQVSAQNGDTVVAMIDGGATIKTFYKKNDHYELHPANSTYKPIKVNKGQDFSIKGILVALLRKY